MSPSRPLVAAATLATAVVLGAAPAAAVGPKSGAYQASVQVSCNGNCQMTFPLVPAGKVLKVEHVSCTVVTGSTAAVFAAQLSSSKAGDGRLNLRPSRNAVIGGTSVADWAIAENVVHYLSPGTHPILTLGISYSSNTVDCTVTGSLVAP